MKRCDVCGLLKSTRLVRGINLCVDCRENPLVMSVFDLRYNINTPNGVACLGYSVYTMKIIMREVREYG